MVLLFLGLLVERCKSRLPFVIGIPLFVVASVGCCHVEACSEVHSAGPRYGLVSGKLIRPVGLEVKMKQLCVSYYISVKAVRALNCI